MGSKLKGEDSYSAEEPLPLAGAIFASDVFVLFKKTVYWHNFECQIHNYNSQLCTITAISVHFTGTFSNKQW